MKKIIHRIIRNLYSMHGRAKYRKANLEWWPYQENLGDRLAYVVFEWMINRKKIELNKKLKKTVHLMGIGSIIGMRDFDAIIWGSGIHKTESIKAIMQNSNYVKYDIRCVRGPVTREILLAAGYSCNECYGDPAILMPLIYQPVIQKKELPFVIINHFSIDRFNPLGEKYLDYLLDIKTSDYKMFINKLVKSEKVIASSLHAIILAEIYGIPAVLVKEGIEKELMKFYDWYYSTGRYSITMASNIEEAIKMEPMKLPDKELLRRMQNDIMSVFPYDIWK